MFDFEACQHCAADKTETEAERITAIENLLYCNEEGTRNLLFAISLDTEDSDIIRTEAAGSLAMLWSEVGIDYEQLFQLPDSLLEEVKNVFDLKRVKIDKIHLENHTEKFEKAFEGTKILR